jgi:hypothetical protein
MSRMQAAQIGKANGEFEVVERDIPKPGSRQVRARELAWAGTAGTAAIVTPAVAEISSPAPPDKYRESPTMAATRST